jgi:hypothetical protein
MHEILINVTPQETRVAMLEQGVVQELTSALARAFSRNIYPSSRAVLPGMQAFVEIGSNRRLPPHRRHLGTPPERAREASRSLSRGSRTRARPCSCR